MDVTPNALELHYYFDDETHTIDAIVRNTCERELLAIAAEFLKVIAGEGYEIVAEPPEEGGFRDIWKIVKKNSTMATSLAAVGLILQGVNMYLARIPVVHPEQIKGWELDNDIKRLTLQKLKKELEKDSVATDAVANEIVDFIDTSYSALKHKSNFYNTLNGYEKVESITTTVYGNNEPKSVSKIQRKDFSKFILKTNELPENTIEDAIIEIEAPVISNNNRMKWRGTYEGKPVNFSMRDNIFRKSVQNGEINLHAAYFISCILTISRELSDTGVVQETGYIVSTVLGEVKDQKVILTEQGKKYKRIKAQLANQKQFDFDNKNDQK